MKPILKETLTLKIGQCKDPIKSHAIKEKKSIYKHQKKPIFRTLNTGKDYKDD